MRARYVAVIVGLAGVLAGCGGVGIPKQQPGETYAGERRDVEGTLEIDSYGCIRVRLDDGTSYAAIWPASADDSQDPPGLSLGWFQRVLEDGDRIRGTAALTPLDELKDWSFNSSYWHAALDSCLEDGESQAIVFDSAEGVSD